MVKLIVFVFIFRICGRTKKLLSFALSLTRMEDFAVICLAKTADLFTKVVQDAFYNPSKTACSTFRDYFKFGQSGEIENLP